MAGQVACHKASEEKEAEKKSSSALISAVESSLPRGAVGGLAAETRSPQLSLQGSLPYHGSVVRAEVGCVKASGSCTVHRMVMTVQSGFRSLSSPLCVSSPRAWQPAPTYKTQALASHQTQFPKPTFNKHHRYPQHLASSSSFYLHEQHVAPRSRAGDWTQGQGERAQAGAAPHDQGRRA